MNAYLFFDWRARPLSVGGEPMPGAVLKFFETTTLTPAAVYADAALTTPLGTEVEAEDDGHFPAIYLSPLTVYRAQLYDAEGILQPDGDVDPLCPPRDKGPGCVEWFLGTALARDAQYPPALWQVLDGTNGTPDGRDRFPIIAGGTYASGDTGGVLAAVTDAGGDHNHGGVTGSTTLDATQMPIHNHRLYVRTSAHERGNTRGFGYAQTAGVEGQIIDDAPYGYLDVAPQSGGNKLIEATGAGVPAGHTHNVGASGSHTHTISGSGQPPFFAIWALMRRS